MPNEAHEKKRIENNSKSYKIWKGWRSGMKGQTLIEVLVALAIATIVVSSVTVISISSLSNAQFVKNQDAAAKYAQEGLEIVRAIRDSDYAGFKVDYSGTYCLRENDTDLAAPAGACTEKNIADTFIRSVKIEQDTVGPNSCGTDTAKVTVEVKFTSGKCKIGIFCHSSKLVSCFSTINPIPAP